MSTTIRSLPGFIILLLAILTPGCYRFSDSGMSQGDLAAQKNADYAKAVERRKERAELEYDKRQRASGKPLKYHKNSKALDEHEFEMGVIYGPESLLQSSLNLSHPAPWTGSKAEYGTRRWR